MEFDKVIDATVLNERFTADIVKDWVGLRDNYLKILKAKGQVAANGWAELWLGKVHDFKNIEDLKTRLQKAEQYVSTDDTLLKVVDALLMKQKNAEVEMAKKGATAAAREKELQANTLVN